MVSDRSKSKLFRRLTPLDRLRLYHAPHQHQATRRELLAGLLGVAAAGCGSDKKASRAGSSAPLALCASKLRELGNQALETSGGADNRLSWEIRPESP